MAPKKNGGKGKETKAQKAKAKAAAEKVALALGEEPVQQDLMLGSRPASAGRHAVACVDQSVLRSIRQHLSCYDDVEWDEVMVEGVKLFQYCRASWVKARAEQKNSLHLGGTLCIGSWRGCRNGQTSASLRE